MGYSQFKPSRLPVRFAALMLFMLSGAPLMAEEPPQRISILVTYGDDPCPEAQGDEIVVCASQPESERYRVPKAIREAERDAAIGGRSWATAVEDYDNGPGRVTRPNSCSPVGSNGYTGCTALMLRQWYAEKRSEAQ